MSHATPINEACHTYKSSERHFCRLKAFRSRERNFFSLRSHERIFPCSLQVLGIIQRLLLKSSTNTHTHTHEEMSQFVHKCMHTYICMYIYAQRKTPFTHRRKGASSCVNVCPEYVYIRTPTKNIPQTEMGQFVRKCSCSTCVCNYLMTSTWCYFKSHTYGKRKKWASSCASVCTK